MEYNELPAILYPFSLKGMYVSIYVLILENQLFSLIEEQKRFQIVHGLIIFIIVCIFLIGLTFGYCTKNSKIDPKITS